MQTAANNCPSGKTTRRPGWRLTYPSEKIFCSSVGMMIFPTEWKFIIQPCSSHHQPETLEWNSQFGDALLSIPGPKQDQTDVRSSASLRPQSNHKKSAAKYHLDKHQRTMCLDQELKCCIVHDCSIRKPWQSHHF